MAKKRKTYKGVEERAKTQDTAPSSYICAGKRDSASSTTLATLPLSTLDAFTNSAAKIGLGSGNLMDASRYPMTRITQAYDLLTSLYRGNWIIQNIVGIIPEDVTKKWFRVTTQDSQCDIDVFDTVQKQTRIRRSVVKGMKWGRLYGGAAAIILLRGQENQLEEPVNYKVIKQGDFRGLLILDRWNGIFPTNELVTDINDPEFGLPMYYEIRDSAGHMTNRVHHSRVIRFVGVDLPRIEQEYEQYWGSSVIEAIYEEIVKRDNVSYNMVGLTSKANLRTMTVKDLDQLLVMGTAQQKKQFWNMMAARSTIESNFGMNLINDGDKYETHSYTFSGLPQVYEATMYDVAGAARIPATKLYGRSPGGLNSTGDSDLQNYYDYLEEEREADFRPVVEKLLPIIALSAWSKIPDDLDFVFEPIWSPDAKGVSEIVRNKVSALTEAFQSFGMTQEAYMRELQSLTDATGMFDSITDQMIKLGADKWIKDLNKSLHEPLGGFDIPPSRGDDLEDEENNDAKED